VRKLVRHSNGSRTLTTIAGKAGECGFADGPIAEARFGTVVDVAVDLGGRVIYVADGSLRKIDEHGMVTTLARFEAGPPPSSPGGLAVLPDHSVLASAPINAVIWRVTQTGEMSIFAGAADQPGSADGPRLEARFNAPSSLAAGKDGTVYVGDSGNNTIRKITPDGRVITVAGVVGEAGLRDGVGNAARLGLVGDMAVDARGTVYFTQLSFDPPWSAVRTLRPNGRVKTLIGDGIHAGVAPGPMRHAGVNMAIGIAVAGDSLFMTDLIENAVLRLRPR
jgi:NHL repeat